tara:strand:+ start:1906 stop:2397 length:492 start_codon:yes stop_codon:yes gene_type:complete
MPKVYIGIGSNLGDRLDNIQRALTAIDKIIPLQQLSPVYETEPKYVVDQPAFLNMAVAGDCEMKPKQLLASLQKAEIEIGRVPSAKRYGPRAIDLDILFYGDQVISEPDLSVPHRLIAERRFVLRPLADIAPQLRHPSSGLTIIEMLVALENVENQEVISIDV